MTIEERCDLLRPMPCREAIRVSWMTEALVRTDGARARLRRWCDAGFPPPPDHPAVGLVGPEPGMFEVIRQTLARLPPPVRRHIARNVVIVAIGERARGVADAWPTLFSPTEDEALQMVIVSHDADLASLTAHEAAHTWLCPIRRTSWETLEAYQNPPDLRALAVACGAETRLAVALNEWHAARLAQTWGFSGLGAQPEKYASRIHAARRELST